MARPKQILMIDDDADDQEIFSTSIKEVLSPVTCVFAGDGTEALEMLKRNTSFHPDFIFTDINMPRMNGIEFLRQLKALNLSPQSKIIMHSTTLNPATVNQCRELGANEFIIKPDTIQGMINRLRLLFEENT